MLGTVKSKLANFAAGMSRRAYVRDCLDRIQDPYGQGAHTFIRVYETSSLETAGIFDERASTGLPLPAYAGVTVSIKDLFDVEGEPTTAGSKILSRERSARRDAEAVARLRGAGFIPIGRTNMSEFAFSGVGLNPHHGTPLNPFDRGNGRIPGGSTSGGAVSVSDGMATVALGTDTGGSCRIPAALCGLVGFKPTAHRMPMTGAMPLSTSLDSIGSIGHSVECVAAVDAVLSGQPLHLKTADLGRVRLGLPAQYVLDNADAPTLAAFSRMLSLLTQHGATIVNVTFPELLEIPSINAQGGFPAVEAYAYHADWIAAHAEDYDPRVLSRILRGKQLSLADYDALKSARKELIQAADERTDGVDALIMPTVPTIAPSISALDADDDFTRINLLMLRNPTIANMLDRCAISLPCHRVGEPPVGFMLIGEHDADAALLNLAHTIELASLVRRT